MNSWICVSVVLTLVLTLVLKLNLIQEKATRRGATHCHVKLESIPSASTVGWLSLWLEVVCA